MPGLDEANMLYEAMKADEDLRREMGDKHTFSIESSYGIHDARVEKILVPRFPLTRNWVTDAFMDGIFRGDGRDPASMTQGIRPVAARSDHKDATRGNERMD